MKLTSVLFTLLMISSILANGQTSDVRMYAFGHSLIDHATSSGKTNIMYWINDISQHSGDIFATGGQYGFLTSHDDLPPSSNWGYNGISGVWDSETEPFSAADVNTILLTAANFIQYVSPNSPHPLDNTTTVIKSTEIIFDWVNDQEANVKYYIYANWPEMDLQSAYPPTPPLQEEINQFHRLTIGQFTDWWIDYQDNMLRSRPQLNTRLIPVGMIISKILSDIIPNQIPFDNLYEDSAPHGKPSIYFLAGMITYMAVFEQNIPANYTPNSLVHSSITNNLNEIREFAWNELLNFKDQNGDNRVFHGTVSVTNNDYTKTNDIILSPNPTKSHFVISQLENQNVKIDIYNGLGEIKKTIANHYINEKINIADLQPGIYYIHIQNKKSKDFYIRKLIIN